MTFLITRLCARPCFKVSCVSASHRTLFFVTDADFQTGLAKIVERFNMMRIAFVYENNKLIGGNGRRVEKQVFHLCHKRLVAGEISVGTLMIGRHLRNQNAAAIVDASNFHTLALLEGRDGFLNGRPQHGSREEPQLRRLGPAIALDRRKTRTLEVTQPLIA